jgi:hypothetical protein
MKDVLFMHYKNGIMSLIYCIFIFYISRHLIESIFHIVHCTSGQVIYNFRPFVSNHQSLFKDNKIFFNWKGTLPYIWIQATNPSFSALLSVSLGFLCDIKILWNSIPISYTMLFNLHLKFIVLVLSPNDLVSSSLFILIKFELTLLIISTGYKSCDF